MKAKLIQRTVFPLLRILLLLLKWKLKWMKKKYFKKRRENCGKKEHEEEFFFFFILLSDDFHYYYYNFCVFFFLLLFKAVLAMESLSGVNSNKNIDNHQVNDNVELQNVYKYLKSTGQVKWQRIIKISKLNVLFPIFLRIIILNLVIILHEIDD